MLVRQILGLKGGSEVVTLSVGTSVADAARTLSEKKIGAIVVVDGDSPRGIFSERDIVRELGRRGEGCLSDTVDNLMTKDMITCAPNETAVEVLQKMTDGRFRHMPVMESSSVMLAMAAT